VPQRAPKLCDRCGQLDCQQHSARTADLARKRAANNPLVSLYKTARWQALRLRLLAANPVCVECSNALATDVDHRKNARLWTAQGHDWWDESNLQCLCKSCHSSKTATEVGFSEHQQ